MRNRVKILAQIRIDYFHVTLLHRPHDFINPLVCPTFGPILLGSEFLAQLLQPLSAYGFNRGQTLAIDSRSPIISELPVQCSFQHIYSQQFPVETPEPIFRTGFCFPIERDLKLPNFIRGYYPGCPGHPRVLRFASSHCVSVPPWLLAPFKIVQINATMRDSDFSSGRFSLTDVASLCRFLEQSVPVARVLPVYLDLTSRRAVHADPAGALNRL